VNTREELIIMELISLLKKSCAKAWLFWLHIRPYFIYLLN